MRYKIRFENGRMIIPSTATIDEGEGDVFADMSSDRLLYMDRPRWMEDTMAET